ncbi:ABC transporter ATP-binding protein [Gordonia sp. NB41Y]|uniref:ABC transporter ATP-binding protein n=1 Tax=Gordonia sp. NB41Y TaxID=875808 RepID=UPI0006B1CE01|nr:ABC transporter ATP-binding protein [Gordonia sp. NB41Y]EMP11665.2 ABC transporter [Gordonia sp. NB41Y]WLP88518.1 ABC transporter ATP-binding protein [Gordonia sp. NB41Y]
MTTTDFTVPTTATGHGFINLERVRKTYGSAVILDDVNLSMREGEFVTLLGASGSGKSTLLNIMAGFVKADSGSVTVDGVDLTRVPPHRRGLGMMFQHYALFPHMSIADNVAYGLRRHGFAKSEIPGLVTEALTMVEMADYADRRPSQLSGGQQQRVALARAIVYKPRVLLMDEPLGALDKILREQLQLEIRRLHREMGINFVFVTHDQQEALTMSDRIALLRNGEILQLGTPEDLYQRPNCRYTAEFIGVSNFLSGKTTRDGFVEDGTGRTLAVGAAAADGSALMIRPEDLQVHTAAGDVPTGLNRVTATVTDCVYLGSDQTVMARTDTGVELVARTPVGRGDDRIRTGMSVELAWNKEDSRVLD